MPPNYAEMKTDSCSEFGATQLANSIMRYWRMRGYHGITARTERVRLLTRKDSSIHTPVYSVMTNIGPTGYPPLA